MFGCTATAAILIFGTGENCHVRQTPAAHSACHFLHLQVCNRGMEGSVSMLARTRQWGPEGEEEDRSKLSGEKGMGRRGQAN